MDIHSSLPYPSCDLSNFAAHGFVVDGEPCASMEGFIQALKFSDPERQRTVRSLGGMEAKKAGAKMGRQWQEDQILWWKGCPMERGGQAYARLLDLAFESLHAQSGQFRKALAETGTEPLTHAVGEDDPRKTALTRGEFCERLESLRSFGRARKPDGRFPL